MPMVHERTKSIENKIKFQGTQGVNLLIIYTFRLLRDIEQLATIYLSIRHMFGSE